ncbi:MAG: hypothetical protein ACK4GC_08185 [Paracoccaceae bacterium]
MFGDLLVLNGDDFDFGPLPKGAVLPRNAIACDWIGGDITRAENGRVPLPLCTVAAHKNARHEEN